MLNRYLKSNIKPIGDIRELNNTSYLVIPSIALVEGVIHSSGSEFPELVLSSVFGANPSTWDGRPVIVDHPDFSNGYLSGSDIGVLEQSYIGKMLNTKVVDNKLVTEIWIDLNYVMNSEVPKVIDMWERLGSGETVELSIGALVYDDPNDEGEWEGEKYSGKWEIVIPDHLAVLSSEMGACSISDGCGTYRTFNSVPIKIDKNQINSVVKYMSKENLVNKKSTWLSGANPKNVDVLDKSCTCPENKKRDLSSFIGSQEHKEVFESFGSRNCFNSLTFDNDRRRAIESELSFTGYEGWIVGYNDVEVIYQIYDENGGSKYFKRLYTSDSNDNVTLGDREFEVKSELRYVEVDTEEEHNLDKNLAKGSDMTDEEKKKMEEEKAAKAEKDKKKDTTSKDTEDTTSKDTEDTTSKDTDEEDKKKKDKKLSSENVSVSLSTFDDIILEVGEDSKLGKELLEGQQLLTENKNAAISAILASSGNDFTPTELDAMGRRQLAKIAKLAGYSENKVEPENKVKPANYAGQPGGVENSGKVVSMAAPKMWDDNGKKIEIK